MSLKVLDIGIVGLDSNLTKSYIMCLNKYGYRVKNIVIISRPTSVSFTNRVKGKIKKILQNLILFGYKSHFEAFAGFRLDFLGRFNYALHAEEVTILTASNINEKNVFETVTSASPPFFIYSGGGIVKQQYFSTKTLLHAHPGYLPNVKGSHGTLWSLLTRGKFGCSCLIMDKGIDTGKILLAKEYETKHLKGLSDQAERIELIMNYYFDPIIRAKVMCEAVVSRVCGNKLSLDDYKENDSSAPPFYFMHQRLRRYVVKKYLC